MKPVIGVSSAWSVETYGDNPLNANIYTGSPYTEVIYNHGGVPLMIAPPVTEGFLEKAGDVIPLLLAKVDGLLFSGGGGAKRFSPPDMPGLAVQQPLRYHFETLLIKEAWKMKLPVVGICRGHQMITEVLGGRMQEKTVEGHQQQESAGTFHGVTVAEGTKLAELVGEGLWQVNSLHCQVIAETPPLFRPAAHSPEGYIEAVEAKGDPFWFGFQYHPEMLLEDDKANRFFAAFIAAAALYRQSD